MFYGGARAGMRTLLDALLPAIEGLECVGNAHQESDVFTMTDVCRLVQEGVERTRFMGGNSVNDSEQGDGEGVVAGRAGYVPMHLLRGERDAGALAVSVVFLALAELSM